MSVASGTLGKGHTAIRPRRGRTNMHPLLAFSERKPFDPFPGVTLASRAHPRLYRFVALGDKKRAYLLHTRRNHHAGKDHQPFPRPSEGRGKINSPPKGSEANGNLISNRLSGTICTDGIRFPFRYNNLTKCPPTDGDRSKKCFRRQ